jgi:hypothetical protein
MADKEGTYSLGEIDGIRLEDIHYKYNFIIQPVINEEEYTIEGNGALMVLNYPEELDFNKGDIITINFYFYYTEKHEEIKNIKLNPEAEENLECENGINVIK